MSLSSVHEQCHQRSVQGGVYLLYLHSFAFKYRYILYSIWYTTALRSAKCTCDSCLSKGLLRAVSQQQRPRCIGNASAWLAPQLSCCYVAEGRPQDGLHAHSVAVWHLRVQHVDSYVNVGTQRLP
jgi:hypothetical protein